MFLNSQPIINEICYHKTAMKFSTPPFVNQILTQFHQAKTQIFIVGGAVRDLLLNRPTYDWDFTTDATPEKILKIFPDAFYDNNYGTVMLTDPKDDKLHQLGKLDKIPVYDITTFRRDIGYSNQRHPDKIEWGQTLDEDLERREFTISAIALEPEFKKEKITSFNIHDPFQGQQDLKSRIIKAVGEPQDRFSEDALRMLRAIRIAAQLSFTIDPPTLAAIKSNAHLVGKLSSERIRGELLKTLATDYPADSIKLLFSSELLHQILPELVATRGVQQGKHHRDDVWIHSLKSLAHCPSKDPIVRLATFIHDAGKATTRRFLCQHCQKPFKKPSDIPIIQNKTKNPPRNTSSTPPLVCPHCQSPNDYRQSVTFYNHEMASTRIAQKFVDRLRLSNKQADKLVTLVRYHMFTVDDRQTDKAIRRFIRKVTKPYLKDMLDLRIGDRLGGGARETSWRLEKFKKRLIEVQKQPFTVHDLKISGHDVMKTLNLKPGPQVGKILEDLFSQVVNKKLENKKAPLLKSLSKLKQS
jgi:tRNA nucleotidyltransferase/poly(A) polymerase